MQTDEELDPDDVEFDEHYIYETRSKCKNIFNSFQFLYLLKLKLKSQFLFQRVLTQGTPTEWMNILTLVGSQQQGWVFKVYKKL